MALRRQVLRIGGTKNRAQQYKLTLRQRVLKFYICYSNVNETDEDALWHISWCVFTQKYQDALRHIIYEMYLMYECICNNISFVRVWRLPWCDVYDGDMIVDSKGHINTSWRCGDKYSITGVTKNRVQQYKRVLRQRVMDNLCYSNVNETDEDASRHIIYIYIYLFLGMRVTMRCILCMNVYVIIYLLWACDVFHDVTYMMVIYDCSLKEAHQYKFTLRQPAMRVLDLYIYMSLFVCVCLCASVSVFVNICKVSWFVGV